MLSGAGDREISRRRAIRLGAGAFASVALGPGLPDRLRGGGPPQEPLIRKAVPATGERIPAVGMGTWQTFMVDSEAELDPLREVLRAFYDLGGRVVDSSPMYGDAESVVGQLASELGILDDLWVATKVWTEGEAEGRAQMRQSLDELRRDRIELMQVHNLVDVEVHLDTLQAWKAQGRFRYVGITNTSERRYPRVEALLDDDRIDFLQTNYSLAEREAAERLLPKAIDRGVAVIVARPFAGGQLFSRVRGRELPGWAAGIGCEAWSQLFLKYVISHPAVTCAIPATSDPGHLRENMGGGRGRLPDEATRRRMEELIDGL